ncbi:hypothetical protein [Vagococcus sp. WN89Y]|uniref:hypothetical protein n=1 Tax=Vagococcus sp. WN89Y TaxID=3457258 RepID=UPI003FCDA70F
MGMGLSELEYYRYVKISDKLLFAEEICVFAMANALFGKGEEALLFLEKHLLTYNPKIFKTYGVILIYLNKNTALINFALKNEEKFKDDLWFSWMVSYYYYIIGDIDNSLKKLKRYLQMMTNIPDREFAERSLTKQINQLFQAYDLNLTTPEHYKESMYLALGVLDDFGVTFRYIDVVVFPDKTAACFIDIKTDDPDLVAEMNYRLIKKQIESGYSLEYELEP